MNTKSIAIAALITFIFTAVWLIFLIWDQAATGPLGTIDQVITYLSRRDWRWTLTYLNAAAVTLSATLLMALLALYSKTIAPEWALVGFVFLPVYCTLNLVVYLSQIALVPALLNALEAGANDALLRLLLAQSLQLWPTSAAAFLNALAYALLGIPSIIYGCLLTRGNRLMKSAGWLLLLNGAACILGLAGYLAGSPLLSAGVMLGGILFFAALIPLSIAFLRPVPQIAPKQNPRPPNRL